VGTWTYRYANLTIRSGLELPEWTMFGAALAGAPEVEVELDREGPWAACGEPLLTPEFHRFQVPGTAEFEVAGGRRIVARPAREAGAMEVRGFLLGTAWASLVYQRGLLALHASAVERDRAALLLCGPSGAGKSSTAAGLMRLGCPLVGDDLCCLTLPGEGPPLVHRGAPRLKLWQEALEHLDFQGEGLQRDHFRAEKYHLPLSRPASLEPLPLAGVVLLGWGPLALTLLQGLPALRGLVEAATYRGYLLEPMGLTASHWERCLAVKQAVPVWSFTRPKDWKGQEAALNYLLTGLEACQ